MNKLLTILATVFLLTLIATGCSAPADEPAAGDSDQNAVVDAQPEGDADSQSALSPVTSTPADAAQPEDDPTATAESEPAATFELPEDLETPDAGEVEVSATVVASAITPDPADSQELSVMPAPGIPNNLPPVLQPLLPAMLEDLIERTGADPSDIQIKSAEAVTWNDGSLGCPEPGMNYTMALVDGYRVTFLVSEKPYYYHTDGGRFFVYCANPPKDDSGSSESNTQPPSDDGGYYSEQE